MNPSIWTSEYYKYCVRLLAIALQNIDRPINVVFGDIESPFENAIKIDIQSEHTLVKLGGRSVDEIIYGTIDLLDGSGKYLIRVPNYGYYSRLDATIEYSLPNIENLKTNDSFADYLKTAVYIAPTIYDTPDFKSIDRKATITLGNHSDRRTVFSQEAEAKGLAVTNVQNVLSKQDLKRVYDKTKIMVNLHQTDHHHTFEELRVLPALSNGVIIVSEDVPLKEVIPYADSIVWSSYGDLARTVQDVQDNYGEYYQRIFTPKLSEQIISLNQENVGKFVRLLMDISVQS